MTKKQIKKYEKPSKYIEKRISKIEKEAIAYLKKNHDMDEASAKKLLGNNEQFVNLLSVADKKIKLEMLDDIMPSLKTAIEKKIKSGSLSQAQKGMTAWGIARDKIMGEDKYSSGLKVGGKNVQINLGWEFDSYQKKKLKKESG